VDPHNRTRTRAALWGALREINVSTVLTLFEMERRSGVVLLQSRSSRGQINLRAGKIVRAAVSGETPLTGKEALYELLAWRQGRFQYRPGTANTRVENPDVVVDDELDLSTSHLLLEAARRTDEGNGWAGGETPA
jgi:hypothetical protein